MDYKKYIELGFVRTDMHDDFEFNQTGFGGFTLEKKFQKGLSIGVSSAELGKPLLYLEKEEKDNYHIVRVTEEFIIDMCRNNQ